MPPTRSPAPTLSSLGSFEGVLDNNSGGGLAPEFTARTMADSTVSLTSLRGRYVLLVPTVVGCGDCVFTMTELAQAYPPPDDTPLDIVILNLFPKDVPESWQGFAETYPEMDVIWAVVNNDRFPIDYDLKTLGTTFVINPEGYIVYRRDHPLWADEFTRLFEVVQAAAKGRGEAGASRLTRE